MRLDAAAALPAPTFLLTCLAALLILLIIAALLGPGCLLLRGARHDGAVEREVGRGRALLRRPVAGQAGLVLEDVQHHAHRALADDRHHLPPDRPERHHTYMV